MQELKHREKFKHQIKNIQRDEFDKIAIQLFQYQAKHNEIYEKYIKLLGKNPNSISKIEEIPFLPIQFFKNHRVTTGIWQPKVVFKSSGTTGQIRSKHYVQDLSWYEEISVLGFENQYNSIQNYCVLALLPSYLERQDASLVYMSQFFMKKSNHQESGFFLNDFKNLQNTIKKCKQKSTPILLIGVSFALLDFAEQIKIAFPENSIIMETGGMKGRRKELIRRELHDILKSKFKTQVIHSEYGMTELLSQAYAKKEGIFSPTPTMKIKIREFYDPLAIHGTGRGLINIIDLGNVDSCAFIATDDIGILHENDTFEVLGRMDNSELRGCNLMIQ